MVAAAEVPWSNMFRSADLLNVFQSNRQTTKQTEVNIRCPIETNWACSTGTSNTTSRSVLRWVWDEDYLLIWVLDLRFIYSHEDRLLTQYSIKMTLEIKLSLQSHCRLPLIFSAEHSANYWMMIKILQTWDSRDQVLRKTTNSNFLIRSFDGEQSCQSQLINWQLLHFVS